MVKIIVYLIYMLVLINNVVYTVACLHCSNIQCGHVTCK